MKEKLKDVYEKFLICNPDVEDVANKRYIVQYRYSKMMRD